PPSGTRADPGARRAPSLHGLGRRTPDGLRRLPGVESLEAPSDHRGRRRVPVARRRLDHFLSPELAIEVQQALGADIIHPLDECLAYPATHEAAERSLELTLRWAARS